MKKMLLLLLSVVLSNNANASPPDCAALFSKQARAFPDEINDKLVAQTEQRITGEVTSLFSNLGAKVTSVNSLSKNLLDRFKCETSSTWNIHDSWASAYYCRAAFTPDERFEIETDAGLYRATLEQEPSSAFIYLSLSPEKSVRPPYEHFDALGRSTGYSCYLENRTNGFSVFLRYKILRVDTGATISTISVSIYLSEKLDERRDFPPK